MPDAVLFLQRSVLGAADDDEVLGLLVTKIGFNLQQRVEMEDVIKRTLALFSRARLGHEHRTLHRSIASFDYIWQALAEQSDGEVSAAAPPQRRIQVS